MRLATTAAWYIVDLDCLEEYCSGARNLLEREGTIAVTATIHDPRRIDVDVLVIGGGFAGIWAALRAAQSGVSVLLVDKAFVSRSGASAVSGGVTTAPTAEDDLEKWVEEFAVRGGHEADQEWTRILLHDQMDRIAELDAWGVPIVRDEQGAIVRIQTRGMSYVRALQFSPREAMDRLRVEAEEAGVRILDRIHVTELLTSDGRYPTRGGRITGAVGFDVRDGTAYVVRAKSVVLSTGLVAIKGFHPVDNDTGDGFAMAYRVGARFIDAEFAAGGTFEFVWGKYFMGGFNLAIGHGARLVNRLGERFMERYDPERLERTEINRIVAAFIREVLDGRGPIYLDLTTADDALWPALSQAKAGRQSVLLEGPIPNPRHHWIPIEPAWTLWNGGKGGLQTDSWCRTNIPGLYAAGAVARNSGVGRHGSAGTPTAHAMVSGVRAGTRAAEDARAIEHVPLDEDQIQGLMRQTFDPLDRSDPRVAAGADSMHDDIRTLLGSTIDVMIQNATRIHTSLTQVRHLRNTWSKIRVPDPHELVKFHEAQNTLDCLELIYQCMLNRTESRETFYRDDFPMTDDFEWRCWHTAQRTSEGVTFERQRIPFENYRYQPPPPEKKFSPIASILYGVQTS